MPILFPLILFLHPPEALQIYLQEPDRKYHGSVQQGGLRPHASRRQSAWPPWNLKEIKKESVGKKKKPGERTTE